MSVPSGPSSGGGLVMLGIAVIMIVLFALGWSGVLRDRVQDHFESVPLTWAPAAGFLILGIWLFGALPGWGGPAFGAPVVIVGLLFIPTIFWTPRWFGPSWYRERRRQRRESAAAYVAQRRERAARRKRR